MNPLDDESAELALFAARRAVLDEARGELPPLVIDRLRSTGALRRVSAVSGFARRARRLGAPLGSGLAAVAACVALLRTTAPVGESQVLMAEAHPSRDPRSLSYATYAAVRSGEGNVSAERRAGEALACTALLPSDEASAAHSPSPEVQRADESDALAYSAAKAREPVACVEARDWCER